MEIGRAVRLCGLADAGELFPTVMMEVVCICGASYERTEKIVSMRDLNSAVCELCGAGLAAWCSFRVPVYRLKKTAQEGEPLNSKGPQVVL